MRFVQQVAQLAEMQDHHPEIFNVYNRVTLTLSTHDAGGLTPKDVRLAQSIQADALHLFSIGEGVAYGSSVLNYTVSGAPVAALTSPTRCVRLDPPSRSIRTHASIVSPSMNGRR